MYIVRTPSSESLFRAWVVKDQTYSLIEIFIEETLPTFGSVKGFFSRRIVEPLGVLVFATLCFFLPSTPSDESGALLASVDSG